MKAVILAGGLATHVSEKTSLYPKPMIEIEGQPAFGLVMRLYIVRRGRLIRHLLRLPRDK